VNVELAALTELQIALIALELALVCEGITGCSPMTWTSLVENVFNSHLSAYTYDVLAGAPLV
jgi:hypothetical protein